MNNKPTPSDQMVNDAHHLKKLIREAEALADESMIAFARLKQAMLVARQAPDVEVHVGQRALMRLNQAEVQAMSMSSNLLRVHEELSDIARETMGGDPGVPTDFPAQALAFDEAVPELAGR